MKRKHSPKTEWLRISDRQTSVLAFDRSALVLHFGLLIAATLTLSCGFLRAADWNGRVDSHFENGRNWGGSQPPRAGEENQSLLWVANGGGHPLNYTQEEGTTVFSEQLIIGGSAKGPTGEMRMSGGTIIVKQTFTSFIGQVNGGKLVVEGGTLSLLGGGEDTDIMNCDVCWTLVLGNEKTGNGVIEVNGGTVNVENGFQIGRRGGTGILEVSGTGRFICGGPVLIPGGSGIKCIVLGEGHGGYEQDKNGEILFLGDGSQGWFNFKPGSGGKISLSNQQKSYFDGLVAEGRIRIDNQRTTSSRFIFTQNGNQGEYQLAP